MKPWKRFQAPLGLLSSLRSLSVVLLETPSDLLVQFMTSRDVAPAAPKGCLFVQMCLTSDISVPLASGIHLLAGPGQRLCPNHQEQEWSVLPLTAGMSQHPSPDSDQQHKFAAFLMSSSLCLCRGNWGRRLLLSICN